MTDAPMPTKKSTPLRRALGLWVLVFYGLGMIIGAGIYVLVGEVAGEAGWGAPIAFLLSALLASITGLAYAELVGRLPEAAGEVAYAQRAFGSTWLSTAVGLAIVVVAVAAAASIAVGTTGYFHAVVPGAKALPGFTSGAVLVVIFTVIASLGVRAGAFLAAGLSLIEVGGLIFIIAIGADAFADLPVHAGKILSLEPAGLVGVMAGAFVAFFAYLGFENLANMAEETRNPGRTVAWAIVIAVVISALLYGLVSLVAVLAVGPERLAQSNAPLCLVVERGGMECGQGFAILALIALSNGILVEIMLVARLLYGMARRGLLPPWLGVVNAGTKVPVRGTILAGAAIMVLILGVPFDWLVKATSGILLVVFAVVNLSLWRLQRREPLDAAGASAAGVLRMPRFLPPMAAALCVALLVIAAVTALQA
jgi:amino acid transporter